MIYNSYVFKLNFLIFSFFLSIFVSGQSLSLAEIYELALDKDPELKIAEATYRAEKEAKAKGNSRSLAKPDH